ncbi:MAG: hypothetical protein IKY73_06060 [Bacteroidaceae bacterium]|nr:hypothetical protein [Bacteroidaceae bacterium]
MKTVKNFLIDFVFCLLITLPCYFLCDMMGGKGIIDWLDIQLGLAAASLLLLIAYILVGRCCKESKGAKILGTMTVIAIATTVIFGVFMLLEWKFPDNTDSCFTGNWEQWFPASIAIATFMHFQERRRAQSYKNDNDLVVAAECQNKVEAEAVRAMLNDKGINAMTVEKGSAMYINTESGAPLQVQVMGKELKRAQELIK